MTSTSYLRIRSASEAGLISETLRRLASEARRTRSKSDGANAGPLQATRRALDDLDNRRPAPLLKP